MGKVPILSIRDSYLIVFSSIFFVASLSQIPFLLINVHKKKRQILEERKRKYIKRRGRKKNCCRSLRGDSNVREILCVVSNGT